MTDLAGQVADHERRLKQQEGDIQHLYHEVRETRTDVRAARTDIATLDRELKDTRADVQAARTDIATLDRELKDTRTEVAQTRQEMREGFGGVGDELATMRQEAGWTRRALSRVMAHLEVEPPGDEED